MKLNCLLPRVLLLLLGVLFSAGAATPPPTPLLTKPEAELLRILNSTAAAKEKIDACRELAVVGSAAAVGPLAQLLGDERFSHEARHALETIPDAGVDAALRRQLPTANGRRLVGVIASLGVRRDAKAVRPLTGFLANADPDVAQAAARALGSIATPGAVKALQSALPRASSANQLALCEGLLRSAETLAANGKSRAAISVYQKLRAIPELPPQVRAGALRGEIITRGPKGIALLKQSLLAPEYETFAVAIRSVLEMRQPKTTQVLADTLPQLSGDQQLVAIKALGELGGPRAAAALLPVAKTGDKATRLAAIQAAIVSNEEIVVALLVELLGDADAEIAALAQDGLAALANPAAAAAIPALLASESVPLRVAGIDLVGRRMMTAAIPDLLRAASDPAPAVRMSAWRQLEKLGTTAELQPLLQLLMNLPESRELELAGEAVSGIVVRAEDPAAIAVVIRACKQAAPAPQAVLLGVLGTVGGADALQTVRLALAYSDPGVQQAALRALAEWPDATAAPALVQVISAATDNAERERAFQGLIRITRDSSQSSAEKLTTLRTAATLAQSVGDRRLLLAGLGDIPTIEALRAVVPYLSEAEVADDASASAVRIAGRLNVDLGKEITPVLLQVVQVAKSEPVIQKARAQIEQLNQNAAEKPRLN